MEDYIVSALAVKNTVRAFAAVTTNMVKKAREIHGLAPVATAALGRTMTAAAMMSKMLKGARDTITVQIKGEGPLGGIVVASDSSANVRGYVYNPEVHLPLNASGKLDVAGAIGDNGYLNVIKDLGLREPYLGYVRLVSGEIGEDMAYYFAFSEQIPSVVALGTLIGPDETVLNAGGFIIQLMPDAEEGTIDFLENKISSLPSISTLLSQGKTAEEILGLIFSEKDFTIVEKSPCRYLCNCSRDRMERNLISLGRKEIAGIIEEQHGAELQCHFCNAKYQFTEADLRSLIDEQE